ncbi:MAG: 5-formyltetrahydrofolate cyclo-ligase [Candidatus Jordarchaeales archaeon]
MKSKSELRRYVWDLMMNSGIAVFPLPPHGRIPNFKGASSAARNVRKLEEYREAKCVFTGPDAVLKPLRSMILADGKSLAYATPHMKEFKILDAGSDPHKVSIGHLISLGRSLDRPVEVAVIGSVAVDLKGNRVGKGSGYGDREIAYLKKLNPNILVGTLVHSVQVFEDLSHLMEPHDTPVDFIATEKELIKIDEKHRSKRRSGVISPS